MDLGLSPLRKEGFSLEPLDSGGTLVLELCGSADMEIVGFLPVYFKSVHAEVQRMRLAEVVLDLHALYFMNSSCLKSFVTWIDLISQLPVRSQYRLRFLTDPHLQWQKRSLDALRRMAMGTVVIETWTGGGQ